MHEVAKPALHVLLVEVLRGDIDCVTVDVRPLDEPKPQTWVAGDVLEHINSLQRGGVVVHVADAVNLREADET